MRRHVKTAVVPAVLFAALVFPRLGLAADVVVAPAPVASPSAAPYPTPIVAACANPSLPAEILAGPVPASTAKPLPVIDATGASGSLVLKLAVAADDNDRDLGLMCVTALRPQHGMIFVFGADQNWEFWMKNTLVPLDMVWLASDGKITTIASHVPASTRETPDDAVARRDGTGRYVVELADGEALSDGLSVGEKLSLPPLRASQ